MEYDYEYEYEEEDIDIEIDKTNILIKMLLDFNISDQEIDLALSRNNFDFEVAIRFFINNYQAPFYTQNLVDYQDMFYEYEADELDWQSELYEKISDLIFLLMNIYNVNLTNFVLTIVMNDNHILQEDKEQYINESIDIYDSNDLTNFVEKVKNPLINYIFNLFVDYPQYYKDVEDVIENLLENEEFPIIDNLEYDIDTSYDSESEL